MGWDALSFIEWHLLTRCIVADSNLNPHIPGQGVDDFGLSRGFLLATEYTSGKC